MSHDVLTSTPTRDADTLAKPLFAMPSGACDSHVHVFGPEDAYPRVDHPHYTLPDGPVPLLTRMGGALGIERFAIVQPSFYGTDNRCLLDALGTLGNRARGVVMIQEDLGDDELRQMHERGVRALRLDLFLRAAWKTADIAAYIRRSMARVRLLGWHVQFYTPGQVVRDLIPYLADLDGDYVIDHMGYMLESDGLTRADFDRLLDVVTKGRGWFKLSAPYRLAKDGNFARLEPLARAIVEAVGDRTVWGSDWPHIPLGERDTGQYLNLLADWIPDAAARKRVLADNPGRLYGFDAT
jgi:predicted TIM-barrel fold metal-dependent hydrolase